MLNKFIKQKILNHFYQISLNSNEKETADSAIVDKYIPSIKISFFYSLLLIPALLLLDSSIVISVLIPTTMVAGTAWFAVSLASMKKKFENFGMELTTHLFSAFVLSLMMLLLATITSLTAIVWVPYIPIEIKENILVLLISALLSIIVVTKLLYDIFAGSLKYDINDAMLTGQNEAAERFFKQSLSLLYTTAQQLRTGMDLQVANYSLGLAFYEVFNNVKDTGVADNTKVNTFLEESNELIKEPFMNQEDADKIVFALIDSFLSLCVQDKFIQSNRSYQAIIFELDCLQRNLEKDKEALNFERQLMTDMRMSIVFSEMSLLIDEFGSSLFNSKT